MVGRSPSLLVGGAMNEVGNKRSVEGEDCQNGGWWFQMIIVNFHPYRGEMIQFDFHFF